ncbi:MAG: hypothetical protein Q8K30_02460 [Candidatus Gracilibacteria bacterium]|nr:hypothetical protein [Candidatus Gracilibacteria bacterium]
MKVTCNLYLPETGASSSSSGSSKTTCLLMKLLAGIWFNLSTIDFTSIAEAVGEIKNNNTIPINLMIFIFDTFCFCLNNFSVGDLYIKNIKSQE